MNENDIVREEILKYLYNLSKQAKTLDKSKANERMVILALHDKYDRSIIISNLLYLIQAGWVKQEKISKIPYFIINTPGVNHFEGPSSFQKSQWVTGINVTNIQGVTVIGDNNYVKQEFGDLYRSLDLLKGEIGKSAQLSDEDKLEYQSEIETIKNQLAKKAPNKTILTQAWQALSTLATIDGVSGFHQSVESLISGLIN